MLFLGDFYWIPIGILLDFHEVSLESLWYFCDFFAIAIGFLLDFYGVSMGALVF